MKTIVFWICFFLVAGISLVIPATIDQTHAARGCCMQKGSNGNWYPNGMNFNQCRSANQRQDGNDNLNAPTGMFWWNVNC